MQEKVKKKFAYVKNFYYFCSAKLQNENNMPTIFILFGFHFMFYSDDHTPVHVHVLKDGKEAKYNIDPEVVLVYNHGYKKNELSMIESVIEENQEIIKERWRAYFNQK